MSLRILIVEDEQIVAADLEIRLTRMGHRVVGMAASGDEAVRLAKEARPDVVLMDIQLEGPIPGTEAAKQIQLETGTQIIYLTAFAGIFFGNPELMQPPGICLCKPFSTHQLQTVLASVGGRA